MLLLAATCHALVSRLCCSVCVGSVVRVRTMYLCEFSKWPGPVWSLECLVWFTIFLAGFFAFCPNTKHCVRVVEAMCDVCYIQVQVHVENQRISII